MNKNIDINTILLIACLALLSIVIIGIVFFLIIFLKRRGLLSIKKTKSLNKVWYKDSKNNKVKKGDIVNYITSLATTLSKLSNDKVGALIVMENQDSLEKYVQIGNKVDSPFFSEFVYSIFYNHSSALHDGAMIIRNFRITSISSYLPVSKRLLSVKYGARHRAAFGISERTDAIAFVVSETSGTISCMHEDDLIILPSESVALANKLVEILFRKYHPFVSIKSEYFIKQIKETMN